MKSNILAFFFTIGSIIMAAFIVWFYNMSDRTLPEMRFASYELTYDADTKEADLLHGVMAYDAVDGDITDRIVVEKTILNEEADTAVVYYAVSDLSGNVTKQSRVFNADIESLRGSSNDFMTTAPGYGMYEGEGAESFGSDGFGTEGFDTEGFGSATELSVDAEGEGENSNAESGEEGSSQEGESTGN